MKRLYFYLLCSLILLAGVAAWVLSYMDTPPRLLSPYILRRSSGHNPLIEQSGAWVSQILYELDRKQFRVEHDVTPFVGASPGLSARSPTTNAASRLVLVSTSQEALKAIEQAQAGDMITFVPGTYRFTGSNISSRRSGSAISPIIVRAQQANTVKLEFALSEGFYISHPYWVFENLHITGTCKIHSHCNHAFHVVGGASHFVSRNNTIADFNAHYKINGFNGAFPDHGVIEDNTLSNTSVRQTDRPVTLIDLVGASHWTVRRNWISDFAKAYSNQVSYGAFFKGGGSNNVFEYNVVICEHKIHNNVGQRVGLSLGGGATGAAYCRDRRCVTEQEGSVIQSNVIAACSDEGIYLNRAAMSKIQLNTLIDTAGIAVRFPESSADVDGNIVDGLIRSRNEGLLREHNNIKTPAWQLYLGLHPVRHVYRDPSQLDLHWRDAPPLAHSTHATQYDSCQKERQLPTPYGAVIDFAACQKAR